MRDRLLDIQDRRLREMDENGVEMMILSLNAPTVQAIPDAKAADALARRANDYLAGEIAKRPDRFQGFAALPMQDPDLAAAELERCVRDLGFKGALVNGFSQIGDADTVTYYDEPAFRPFWKTVEALGTPFYLHPRNPLLAHAHIFKGHEWLLGPTWGFGQETAVHALRLTGSGLFDDCPELQIVLGHMGEGLPFSMWRIDHRNAWMELPPSYPAKKPIADYFRANFHLTTSGNFRTPTLIDAIAEIACCSPPTGRSRMSIMPRDGSTMLPSTRRIATRSAAPMPIVCSSSALTIKLRERREPLPYLSITLAIRGQRYGALDRSRRLSTFQP